MLLTQCLPLPTYIKGYWVNLILGLTLQHTGNPVKGEGDLGVETCLINSCYRNWDKVTPPGEDYLTIFVKTLPSRNETLKSSELIIYLFWVCKT